MSRLLLLLDFVLMAAELEIHCIHCPLSGGPEARTFTESEAGRSTLRVPVHCLHLVRSALALAVKPGCPH